MKYMRPLIMNHINNRNMQTRLSGIITGIVILIFMANCQVLGQGAVKNLSVMSYNIRNAKGLDDHTDLNRIAEIIRKSGAQVVALQELDSVTNRSGHKNVLKGIANLSGMHATYAPAIDYDGGKYGIGILSVKKPERGYKIALPGREEQRILLVAEFDKYILACTHLSLTEADRMASVQLIAEEAKKANKPFLLAGDFNALPASEMLTELQKDFLLLNDVTAFTFPANKPSRTIDYIALFRHGAKIKISSAKVLQEPVASDHLPVVVRIKKLSSKRNAQ